MNVTIIFFLYSQRQPLSNAANSKLIKTDVELEEGEDDSREVVDTRGRHARTRLLNRPTSASTNTSSTFEVCAFYILGLS